MRTKKEETQSGSTAEVKRKLITLEKLEALLYINPFYKAWGLFIYVTHCTQNRPLRCKCVTPFFFLVSETTKRCTRVSYSRKFNMRPYSGMMCFCFRAFLENCSGRNNNVSVKALRY